MSEPVDGEAILRERDGEGLAKPVTQWVRAGLLRPLDYVWVEGAAMFGVVLRVEVDVEMGLAEVQVMGAEPMLHDLRSVVEVPVRPLRAAEWNQARWAAVAAADET